MLPPIYFSSGGKIEPMTPAEREELVRVMKIVKGKRVENYITLLDGTVVDAEMIEGLAADTKQFSTFILDNDERLNMELVNRLSKAILETW